jgi:hypothetical protein
MDAEEKIRTLLIMQEKKNIRKLISLIVLLACTAAVYYFQQGESQALVDPSLFKVEDPAKIDRVVLELKGRKVDLHFDGTHWKVNRFEADRALIDVLFAALAQALPKRPVAAIQRDSINGLLDSKGVTVSLFEGPEIRKQFLAGGSPQKRETYFRQDKNSEAYLMTIPGYRVYLAEIFSMDENGWRDKRIFDFAWRNFKSLTTSFPSATPEGFVIRRPDMSLTVTVVGMNEPDTSRVNAYLDDLLQLTADQIISRGTSKRYDSLAQTPPVNTIEVSDIANRTYRLELFSPLPGETLILGTAHDGDLVLFDRKKLFRVVKKRTYFDQKTGK